MELKDGLVGRALIKYFADTNGTEAVDAQALHTNNKPQLGQMDYTMTFAHGVVQNYRVTFGQAWPEIVDATPLN